MRLNALAASALLASAEAGIHDRYARDLVPRAFVAVGPSGVCPVQPDVTVILQPVYNGTSISYVTQTQTVTNGGSVTTATPTVSPYTPPYTPGQGIPSGYITDLPVASFFFLAYSTPGAAASPAPLAKRQQAAQSTASPISLVDLSLPTPGPPALAAGNCDSATPLDLVQGVLNGKGFSVGKLFGSTNAVLGALNAPVPDTQVNLTFAISNGQLQWNAPDVGGASFYSCDQTVYAGFPNLNIAGCTEVLVAPVAGSVCISYVTSTRTVNPTFTAPLGASSTSSGATATGAGNGGASGSGSSATASGTDNGGASGSSSSATATGTDSGSGSSASATVSASNASGSSGSGDLGSSTTTATTSSASTSGSPVPRSGCLIALPDTCINGLTNVAAGLAGVPGAACLTSLLPQLDLSGTAAAAVCLSNSALLTNSGNSILACLSTQLLCSSTSTRSSSAAGPSASTSSCLVTLPANCAALGTAPLLDVPGDVLQCAADITASGLDITGTANAASCLVGTVIPGVTTGASVLSCLQQKVLCVASSTSMSQMSMSTTSSASSSSSALPVCVPLPGACSSLPTINALNLNLVTDCVTALTNDLTTAGLGSKVGTVTTCATTFTTNLATNLGDPATLLTCLSTGGVTC